MILKNGFGCVSVWLWLGGLAGKREETMITRDDITVSRNPNSITVSAMIGGYREKTQYIFVDEEEAITDFLTTHNEGV